MEFDFHGKLNVQTDILFQKKELKKCSQAEDCHLNIRVLQGEKSGASYTKDFSKESLEDCYRRAVDSLKLSDKSQAGCLSQGESYNDFSAFFDKNFTETSIEDKIAKAKEINTACLNFNKNIQPIYSHVFDIDENCFFANSKGNQSSYRFGSVLVSCRTLAVQDQSRAEGQMSDHAKNYRDIDFKAIGVEAGRRALKKLNYSLPKTKRYPVIFQSGQATASLLKKLADLMSGKSVFEGLSLFKDSIGQKIFSKDFSLYDDPFALWGIYSSPFDGEGFASEKTSLVNKACLENYLTSSFFAKALKVPHTKKACWLGDGLLGIKASNLVMAEGESSFEELLNEFPQVVVIDYLKGEAGYNLVSGDFSIESEGFLWEKGSAHPICQFTVSGNIRDVFANILKIGKDSQVYSGSVKAPSFLVPDLMIAGK